MLKNNSNSNNKQMDDFLNMMLREEVKRYKKIKSTTNPNITIKENFIFEITKKATILYIQEINNRNIKISEDMFLYREIVSAITERHIFYSFKYTEQERISSQNNLEYKHKLIYETVDDLIVNIGLGHVSSNITTALYPPVSKIIVLNNLLYELYKSTEKVNNKNYKYVAIKNVFLRIIDQVKSVSLLLDKSLIADAFSIWRGLYESELTLVVLANWDETISKEYLEFIEFQLLERSINMVDKTDEEVQKRLENKANIRQKKPSSNFIHYGWLMQTKEFYDNNCDLNLKDGLAVVAGEYVKYASYQLASNISHSPYFSKILKPEQLLTYIVEMILYSLETIFESIIYYLKESNLEVNENISVRIEESLQELKKMIKIMEVNAQ